MDVVVSGAPVGEPVDETGIAMEGEDDRLFDRELNWTPFVGPRVVGFKV